MRHAALGLAVLALSGSAFAQSAGNFSEAAASPVHYTHATSAAYLTCATLRDVAIPDMTIVSVMDMPELNACRVRGVLAPAAQFEVTLPNQWNRRLYMFGNGGYAGETLANPARQAIAAGAVKAGFVVAQTDTGHDAAREPLGTFAGNTQEMLDYAFRAVHRTVETAKILAAAFYGRPATFSYWDGCSTGGREGLMATQRYPKDFDGVIAGAPVRNFVDTMVNYVWNAQALDDAGLTLAKMNTVATATLAHCDAAHDGWVADPSRCDFSATRDVKQCAPGSDADDCLTARQAAAIERIQNGITLPDGRKYFFGWPKGMEVEDTQPDGATLNGWANWLIAPPGQVSRHTLYMTTFMQNMAFGHFDPNWDFHHFDFVKDPARMTAARELLVPDAVDLTPFRSNGGKLIMYHGWADPALTPFMSVDYYERAMAANGPATADFFRLFMIPGMNHCRGGVATDRFDAISAIVNWVEAGIAPDQLRATRVRDGHVDRSRPLCPYPREAVYQGSGDRDDAASYACKLTNG